MKIKTILCYSDPGHAWFKVKNKELIDLSIAHEISSFSYAKGDYAYLEEDCDAKKYLAALRNKKISFKIKEQWTNRRSKIRNYSSYVNFSQCDCCC